MDGHTDMTKFSTLSTITTETENVLDLVRSLTDVSVLNNRTNWNGQRTSALNAFTRVLQGAIPGAIGSILVALKRVGYMGTDEITPVPVVEVSGASPLTTEVQYQTSEDSVEIAVATAPGVSAGYQVARQTWLWNVPVQFTESNVTIQVTQALQDGLLVTAAQYADYTLVANVYSQLTSAEALWHHSSEIPGKDVPGDDWVIIPTGFERTCRICFGRGKELKEWPFIH